MLKCPVCKTECGDATFCPECGFKELAPTFLNKEEGENWVEKVLWPYRERYWKSLSQFKIEHNGLFWELVECNPTEKISEIRIPYGIEVIGKGAFRYCRTEWFLEIVIPATVSVIEDSAFDIRRRKIGWMLKIPNSVVRIGAYAFNGWVFPGIVIPKSVQYIGGYAFTTSEVFCEAENAPNGWASNAFDDTSHVYWSGTWHYEYGIPHPN